MKQRTFLLLSLLLALLLPCACSNDTGDLPVEGRPLTGVTLQLGASGAITARSYGGDDNALEHEFINNLTVVVTNKSGEVEYAARFSAAQLDADDQTNTPAAKGNYLKKIIEDINITSGVKTIYAFANFDNLLTTEGENIDELLGKVVEDNDIAALATLEAAQAKDPAAGLNDGALGTTKFIPMCVKQSVTLYQNGQTVLVEMERLVCRVELTVQNSRTSAALEVGELKMGTFATAVPLFLSSETTDFAARATAAETFNAAENTFSLPAASESSVSTKKIVRYVNATEDNAAPFDISVNIVGESAPYLGATARTALPRNSIFPVLLNFADYTMQLSVDALIAPIGGYPIELVKSNLLTESYNVSLPEGCTFSITPKLLDMAGKEDTEATATWSIYSDPAPDWLTQTSPTGTQTYASSDAAKPSAAGLAFTGYVSAQSSLTAQLKLHSVSGKSRKFDYYVTLATAPLENFDFSSTTARRWAHPGQYAVINMRQ